ncbi:hypothetical protein IJ596_05430 [bacterium]|nr:hypothetical protein [bacterium]
MLIAVAIIFNILICAYLAYILVFSIFWDKKIIQNFLRKDSKYGISQIAFMALVYPFCRSYDTVRLYDKFMLISSLRKIQIEKSLSNIYIVGTLWGKYQILRVIKEYETLEFVITDKQAEIIQEWLKS